MALRTEDMPAIAEKLDKLEDKPKSKSSKRTYTVAEWLQLPEQPHNELFDGVVKRMPNSTHNHDRIIRNIDKKLDDYVLSKQIGTVGGQVNVIIDGITGANGWIPDAAFVGKDNPLEISDNWYGRPDWVLEVWAANKQKPARIKEKRLRWQSAGVPELWEIITGEEQIVNVYRLDENNIYQLVAQQGETTCSEIIEGFCIERSVIFANLVPENLQ